MKKQARRSVLAACKAAYQDHLETLTPRQKIFRDEAAGVVMHCGIGSDHFSVTMREHLKTKFEAQYYRECCIALEKELCASGIDLQEYW